MDTMVTTMPPTTGVATATPGIRTDPGQHGVLRERDLDLLVQFVPCRLLASAGRVDIRLGGLPT